MTSSGRGQDTRARSASGWCGGARWRESGQSVVVMYNPARPLDPTHRVRLATHASALDSDAPVSTPRLAGDGLLQQEARSPEHGQATVRELPLLHQAQLRRVLRPDVRRVEAEIARDVPVAEGLRRGARHWVELLPTLGDAHLLRTADASQHHTPNPHGELWNLIDGRTAVAREERVDLLLHEKAGTRQHRDPGVSNLRLTQAVDLVLGLADGEAQRVEAWVVDGGEAGCSWETVRELRFLLEPRHHLRRRCQRHHLRCDSRHAGKRGGLDGSDREHDFVGA